MAAPSRKLPTVPQVQAHLGAHRARGPSRQAVWAVLAALAAACVLALFARHPLLLVLPWLVLAGIGIVMYRRVDRLRRLERRVTGVQELAMLRHHEAALQAAWRLLPSAGSAPALHRRLVAAMAHCLEELGACDAAIVAYDDLLADLPQEHAASVSLRIQRAIAQLRADHLADADDTLRRLRSAGAALSCSAIGAAYRLARLLQLVRTNHFADAVEGCDGLLDELRPLGVDAGYGHALVALAYHHLAGAAAGEQAALWWSRATLLVAAPALLDRFAELRPLLGAGCRCTASQLQGTG